MKYSIDRLVHTNKELNIKTYLCFLKAYIISLLNIEKNKTEDLSLEEAFQMLVSTCKTKEDEMKLMSIISNILNYIANKEETPQIIWEIDDVDQPLIHYNNFYPDKMFGLVTPSSMDFYAIFILLIDHLQQKEKRYQEVASLLRFRR